MLYNILSFFAGVFVTTVVFMILDNDRGYYRTPSDGKLELNWTTQQVLALFSKPASKRWYEARCHCYLGVFVSLLCTFGLVHLVRVDFMHDSGSYGRNRTLIIPAFLLSKKNVLNGKYLGLLIQRARRSLGLATEEGERFYYYQTFVAGKNVVHDFTTPMSEDAAA